MKIPVMYPLLFLVTVLFITSCDPEPMEQVEFKTLADRDLLVSCEGQFQNANGNITYINTDTDRTDLEAYTRYNSEPVGDVLQQLIQKDDKIFMLTNLPGSVKVLNTTDLQRTTTINIAGNPKNGIIIGTEMWINDAFNGLHLMNLIDNTIERIDSTGPTTELAHYNDKVFVAHSGEFSAPDNKVYVYDTETRERTQEIEIVDSPNSVAISGDKLYVVGGVGFNEPIQIGSIDLIDLNVEVYSLPMSEISGFGPKIRASDGQLFLLADGLYTYDPNTQEVNKIFSEATSPYGLDIDELTGDIFVCDAVDYQSQGTLYVLDQNGNEKVSYKTGIVPNSVLRIK